MKSSFFFKALKLLIFLLLNIEYMKNSLKRITAFFLFVECLTVQAQNILLPNELRMASYARIEKNDSIFQFAYKTYQYTEYQHFSRLLLDEFISGKHTLFSADYNRAFGLYSPLNQTITTEKAKNLLGEKEYITRSYDNNYEVVEERTMKSELDSASFKIVGFEESWAFDSIKRCFEKKVYNIQIIREETEETDNVRYRIIGSVNNNLNKPNKPTMVAQIAYEHPLIIGSDWVTNESDQTYSTRCKNAGLIWYSQLGSCTAFSDYSREYLCQTLCRFALTGKLKAVDFYTKQVLDSVELSKRLGAQLVVYESMDEFGNMQQTTYQSQPSLSGFDALIFTEDWFFDSNSFSFSKKVKEIAFVKYSYNDDDTEYRHPKRNILFSLILNN
jgi:hypothetical protein